jgi:hypothetical protein
MICDKNNNLKESGFTGPVKSVSVPPGRAVKLYNNVELKGKDVIFKESQACIEELNFAGFLQME